MNTYTYFIDEMNEIIDECIKNKEDKYTSENVMNLIDSLEYIKFKDIKKHYFNYYIETITLISDYIEITKDLNVVKKVVNSPYCSMSPNNDIQEENNLDIFEYDKFIICRYFLHNSIFNNIDKLEDNDIKKLCYNQLNINNLQDDLLNIVNLQYNIKDNIIHEYFKFDEYSRLYSNINSSIKENDNENEYNKSFFN